MRRCLVALPGHARHDKIGEVVEVFEGVLEGFSLGWLIALRFNDGIEVAFPKENLRLLSDGTEHENRLHRV